jgi:hypothetical protein
MKSRGCCGTSPRGRTNTGSGPSIGCAVRRKNGSSCRDVAERRWRGGLDRASSRALGRSPARMRAAFVVALIVYLRARESRLARDDGCGRPVKRGYAAAISSLAGPTVRAGSSMTVPSASAPWKSVNRIARPSSAASARSAPLAVIDHSYVRGGFHKYHGLNCPLRPTGADAHIYRCGSDMEGEIWTSEPWI